MDNIEEAKKEIANAAKMAVEAIALAAENAKMVLCAATAEASKVANKNSAYDHDLLIELRTKMQSIKEDIKDLKDGTTTKIQNHEERLNSLESGKTKQTVLISIGIGLITVLSGLLITHMFN